jgi:hypothetical protein
MPDRESDRRRPSRRPLATDAAIPVADALPPGAVSGRVAGPTYEEQLKQDPRWALSEGSRHFDEKSRVFDALHKFTARLDELEIPYAIVGGMALFRHGLRRFTEDVDVLVTTEDLKKIHSALSGLGYLPAHRYSKNLRDTELGVRIEFLTTGDFPGDGKEKPVAFPDPRDVGFEADGIRYIDLPRLLELKLASGMTEPGRLKDLSDVQELIKIAKLPIEYISELNPYVRDKFIELWKRTRTRYVTLWRNKWLTAQAKTIEEMVALLRSAAETLDAMRRDGVILESDTGIGDDYATLSTTDPDVAKKYDMVDESEFWGIDEDERPDQRNDQNTTS